jgi:hypothetical protein
MGSLLAFPVLAARYKPWGLRWAVRVTLEPYTTAMRHISKWNSSTGKSVSLMEKVSDEQYPA